LTDIPEFDEFHCIYFGFASIFQLQQTVCQNCRELSLEAFSEKCLNKNQRHFINLPRIFFLALCQTASRTFPGTLPKLPQKTFPAFCHNCLQKLFLHFNKTASKNYTGTFENASV
jgi:hypothetical protein